MFAVNVLILLAILTYAIGNRESDKKAFILNQKVFSEFRGTLLLEQRLRDLKMHHQRQLDSLSLQIEKNPTPELKYVFEENFRQFTLAEEELSNKYTTDIWKEINQHVEEFGKQHGYDFIFGASGDGSLMFAKDAHNITGDVIHYINKKHEGE